MPPPEIKLQALLVCDFVARDATSGKAIITGVFDRIFCPSLPAVHQAMVVYFRVVMPAGARNASVNLAFRQPPHGTLQETPSIPTAVADNGVLEGNVNIQGLPIQEAGIVEIHLIVDGKQIGTYEIQVISPGAHSETIH